MLKFIIILTTFTVIALSGPSSAPVTMDEYGDCVEKYRSGWGESCAQCANSQDSYAVYLRNICTESIDVMVCVQEADKSWKKYQHSRMAPRDSLRAYACIGTGKYLSWARKAGDESTVFPSLEDVNRNYKD
ncbi:MAG: hypothetical protein K9J06_05955 [Flavobacteriales bacterium]|nr:hypothetical protein [Flavobacteriales bacterium]